MGGGEMEMADRYGYKSPGGSDFDRFEGPAPAGGSTVWVEKDGKWGKGIGHDRQEAEGEAFEDYYDDDDDDD